MSTTVVPASHVPQLRPLDGKRVPGVDPAARRDITHREILAGDIKLALKLLVEACPEPSHVGRNPGDRDHVALLGRSADQAHIDFSHSCVKSAELPVHPALGLAALSRTVRPQTA